MAGNGQKTVEWPKMDKKVELPEMDKKHLNGQKWTKK